MIRVAINISIYQIIYVYIQTIYPINKLLTFWGEGSQLWEVILTQLGAAKHGALPGLEFLHLLHHMARTAPAIQDREQKPRNHQV